MPHRQWHSGIISLRPVPDQKMPDCVALFRCGNNYGIVRFFYSGTGLTGYRKVRHQGQCCGSESYIDADPDLEPTQIFEKLRTGIFYISL